MSPRWSPSVTVAAIIERDGRYLLVEEHTPEGLMLNNPAGHLDPGESLVEAAAREALEETARVFTPEALVGVYLARFRRPAADGSPQGGSAAVPPGGSRKLRGGRAFSGDDVTYLRFAFCGSAGEPEADRALDTGIVRTLWLDWDELQASASRHRSPLVLRSIADHRAGVRHPLALLGTDPSLYDPLIKTLEPPP